MTREEMFVRVFEAICNNSDKLTDKGRYMTPDCVAYNAINVCKKFEEHLNEKE